MENIRFFLILSLITVVFLFFQAWEKDNNKIKLLRSFHGSSSYDKIAIIKDDFNIYPKQIRIIHSNETRLIHLTSNQIKQCFKQSRCRCLRNCFGPKQPKLEYEIRCNEYIFYLRNIHRISDNTFQISGIGFHDSRR